MLFHEVVYTSAAALLEGPSGSDLGIVLKSRGFPAGLDRELAAEHYYSLLAGISVHDVEAHPPRLVVARRGSRKEHFCLSRAIFAGADHTGRVTPLVHHLVFPFQQMVADGISPAAVLTAASNLFYRQWKRPPTWVDPLRDVPCPDSPERLGEFPSAEWRQVLGHERLESALASAAECLMAFASTGRRLVICLPVATARLVHRLIGDLLALLPDEVQFQTNCASHVINSGDCPPEAALVFTYPGTQFLDRQKNRADGKAPLIIDVSWLGSQTSTTLGKYGIVVASVIRSGKAALQLDFARRIASVLESGPEDPDLFDALWRLSQALRDVQSADDVMRLGADAGRIVRSSPAASDVVSRWGAEMVKRQLVGSSPTQWELLSAVAWSGSWPHSVRNLALKTIRDHPEEGLPVFLSRVQPGSPEDRRCRQFLSQVLADRPHFVTAAIERSVSTCEEKNLDFALLLIGTSAPGMLQPIIASTPRAIGAAEAIRGKLLPAIVDCAYRSAESHTRAWFDRVRVAAGTGQWNDPNCRRYFFLPLLRRLLSDATVTRDAWSSFSADFVEIAIREGVLRQELDWLASVHRPPSREVLAEWKRRAASMGQDSVLADVLRELGFSQEEPVTDGGTPHLPVLVNHTVRRVVRPRSHLNLTIITWLLAAITTAMLVVQYWLEPGGRYFRDLLARWRPAPLHRSVVSITYAASVSVIALLSCLVLETILRSVRIQPRHLRLVRLLRWLMIAAMGGAGLLLTCRLLDVWGVVEAIYSACMGAKK